MKFASAPITGNSDVQWSEYSDIDAEVSLRLLGTKHRTLACKACNANRRLAVDWHDKRWCPNCGYRPVQRSRVLIE